MKFAQFCQALSNRAGSSKTFLTAIVLIIVWALTGPYFHYNDTWQLIINTSTTIITFLMVFLIQNTQNRDNDILHLKIDELIRATQEAQNATLSLAAFFKVVVASPVVLRDFYDHCQLPFRVQIYRPDWVPVACLT